MIDMRIHLRMAQIQQIVPISLQQHLIVARGTTSNKIDADFDHDSDNYMHNWIKYYNFLGLDIDLCVVIQGDYHLAQLCTTKAMHSDIGEESDWFRLKLVRLKYNVILECRMDGNLQRIYNVQEGFVVEILKQFKFKIIV